MQVMRFAHAAAVLAVVIAFTPSLTSRESDVVRHFTPRDQEVERYEYVPVSVPTGTTRLTFAYHYDAKGGANAIDLGVFEPGPLALSSRALRGWSGGSRDTVTIGIDDASPGYWPGPLPPGEWHVMLGLYKVAPEGVDVTVSTTFSREPAGAIKPLPMRNAAPLKRGPDWYAGVVHAHTTESDGVLTASELIEKARGERLDFIAITDHNNTTHQRVALDRPDLLVITGEEVTTPNGHFNVWGLGGDRDYIDFRIRAGDGALATLMEKAHRRGAVIGINHPVTDCLACTWTHDVPAAVAAIEIANGSLTARQQSMAMWDTLLRAGRRITAVEGRDWHRGPDPIGAPVLRVRADELSTPAVLDALRRGRAIVMANASMPPPDFTIATDDATFRVGDTVTIPRGTRLHVRVDVPPSLRTARVEWVWNGETLARLLIGSDGRVTDERYAVSSGYARVHLVDTDGNLIAVTNPIFVIVR